MSYSFDARFGLSRNPLAEIVERTSDVLSAHDMLFMECVWRLNRGDGGGGTLGSREPMSIEDIGDVAALTRAWWGQSLEWHSPDFGEVYLRVLSAEGGFYVVYNEGKGAVRARVRDSEAKAELVSMLVEIVDVLDAGICVYGDKSGETYRPPSPSEIEAMIDPKTKWPKALAVARVSLLSPELLAVLRGQESAVKWTVDGKVIVSKI